MSMEDFLEEVPITVKSKVCVCETQSGEWTGSMFQPEGRVQGEVGRFEGARQVQVIEKRAWRRLWCRAWKGEAVPRCRRTPEL